SVRSLSENRMTIPIKLPALSSSMELGTLAHWRTKPGELVRRGDVIAEIETDKTMLELEAEADGTVVQLLVEEGTRDIQVGQVLALLKPPSGQAAPTELDAATSTARINASPSAKRLAKELGVDLFNIRGTGPDGRIVGADIEAHSAAAKTA